MSDQARLCELGIPGIYSWGEVNSHTPTANYVYMLLDDPESPEAKSVSMRFQTLNNNTHPLLLRWNYTSSPIMKIKRFLEPNSSGEFAPQVKQVEIHEANDIRVYDKLVQIAANGIPSVSFLIILLILFIRQYTQIDYLFVFTLLTFGFLSIIGVNMLITKNAESETVWNKPPGKFQRITVPAEQGMTPAMILR